jgi:ubiquinone/menaquinone biosynthesis C-methylase UbiE
VNKRRQLNVDDAYSLKSPADSVRLYAEWAETYDADFVEMSGYVAYLRVAELLLRQRDLITGPVLDVGCGTGVVGERIRDGGITDVDGVDISPQMLVEARKKVMSDGSRVYRRLISADLTKSIEIPDSQYAGLISAGTFTHGHLGPDSLDELWRVAAAGAVCVIGIRDTHYVSMGFCEKLSDDVAKGTITKPDIVKANMYAPEASSGEHVDDKALIVVCRTL